MSEGKKINRWAKAAVCVISGMLLSLAYPNLDVAVDFGFIAWLMVVPLMIVLWNLRGARLKRRGFALGYLFGLGFFLINVRWLCEVSWLGVVVLGFYLALYPALWSMCVAACMNPWARKREQLAGTWASSSRSLAYAMAHACTWAGLEWLRGWALTGFGWNGLGVAMHNQAVMAQFADVFGVAGLSGLMVFVQSIVLQVSVRMVQEAKLGKKRAHLDFGLCGLLLTGVFSYGVWRLADAGKRETFPLDVCLVQLNVPQEAARQLWTAEEIHVAYEEEVEKAMERVAEMNQAALEKSADSGVEADVFYPDWLVLPEVALNDRLLSTADGVHGLGFESEATIAAFREAGKFDILLGLGELEAELLGDQMIMVEDPDSWNSMAIIPKEGPLQTYQKKHLVMFGEYIPLVNELPLLKRIYEQQAGTSFDGAFAAGTAIDPLPMTVNGHDFSIIPSICFEDTVPREARSFLRNEAQVIVNITNDGWFGESCGAAQHFANAKFRCIELRRPMVRCANTGVSAVVRINGHAQMLVDDEGSHFTRGALLATIPIPKQSVWSPYQYWGDIPVYTAATLSLLLMVIRKKLLKQDE
jgi:apolipoprotein N-acyltransferase